MVLNPHCHCQIGRRARDTVSMSQNCPIVAHLCARAGTEQERKHVSSRGHQHSQPEHFRNMPCKSRCQRIQRTYNAPRRYQQSTGYTLLRGPADLRPIDFGLRHSLSAACEKEQKETRKISSREERRHLPRELRCESMGVSNLARMPSKDGVLACSWCTTRDQILQHCSPRRANSGACKQYILGWRSWPQTRPRWHLGAARRHPWPLPSLACYLP